MATRDEIKQAVREVFTEEAEADIYVSSHADRQLLVYESVGLAVWIRDPRKLAAIAARHGVAAPLTDAEAASLEIVG